jgi:phage pi2 protein 07
MVILFGKKLKKKYKNLATFFSTKNAEKCKNDHSVSALQNIEKYPKLKKILMQNLGGFLYFKGKKLKKKVPKKKNRPKN